MTERILVAGPCPDSAFCIKMGGCMSGCTSGPGPESFAEPAAEALVVPEDQLVLAGAAQAVENAIIDQLQ